MRRRVAGLAGLTTLMTALMPLAAPSSASQDATAGACPDVVFIGSRGSGQEYETKTLGLGKHVHTMYEELQRWGARNNADVGVVANPYTAAAVDTLVPSALQTFTYYMGGPAGALAYKINHLDRYAASIEEGVRFLKGQVISVTASCSDVQVVLGGYSQGAIVANQAMRELAASNPDVLDNFRAAVLLADGDRSAPHGVQHFGSADPAEVAQGIRPYLRSAPNTPPPMADRVASICDEGDIVCDFNLHPSRNGFARGAVTHTTYGDGPIIAATAWAAGHLTAPPGAPPPPPEPSTLSVVRSSGPAGFWSAIVRPDCDGNIEYTLGSQWWDEWWNSNSWRFFTERHWAPGSYVLTATCTVDEQLYRTRIDIEPPLGPLTVDGTAYPWPQEARVPAGSTVQVGGPSCGRRWPGMALKWTDSSGSFYEYVPVEEDGSWVPFDVVMPEQAGAAVHVNVMCEATETGIFGSDLVLRAE